MIKISLSCFYDVDYIDIDEDFLEETTPADLWTVIAGDPRINELLVPHSLENDMPFSEITKNIGRYESKLIPNSKRIAKNITQQFNSNFGRYSNITDISHGVAESYYWIPIRDLMLFENIDLLGTRL